MAVYIQEWADSITCKELPSSNRIIYKVDNLVDCLHISHDVIATSYPMIVVLG